MEVTTQMTGGWLLVTRHRSTPLPATTKIRTYTRYPAYYADAVRRSPSPSAHNQTLSPKTQNPPPTPYYISPHSSGQLGFPPSPRYTEWKGRYFRCCRMGHNASRCKNPKKCGRCWGDGHTVPLCKEQGQILKSRPTSPASTAIKPKESVSEPSFSKLLNNPINIGLSKNIPQKIVCFVERDDEYYKEKARLEKAIVMYNPDLEIDLTMEEIAEYAVTSGLVKVDEVQVAIMNGSRYIISLSENIDSDTFIKAIPLKVWRKGFSFSLEKKVVQNF